MLYGIIYCCKASEALGLLLCIICVSEICSIVLIWMSRTLLSQVDFTCKAKHHIEISSCVIKLLQMGEGEAMARRREERKTSSLSLSGCSALCPLKALEQHNNLFQYGALLCK